LLFILPLSPPPAFSSLPSPFSPVPFFLFFFFFVSLLFQPFSFFLLSSFFTLYYVLPSFPSFSFFIFPFLLLLLLFLLFPLYYTQDAETPFLGPAGTLETVQKGVDDGCVADWPFPRCKNDVCGAGRQAG
jgi:hypothetical protein